MDDDTEVLFAALEVRFCIVRSAPESSLRALVAPWPERTRAAALCFGLHVLADFFAHEARRAVVLLLELGADPNIALRRKRTSVLMAWLSARNADVTRLLLEAGARFDPRSDDAIGVMEAVALSDADMQATLLACRCPLDAIDPNVRFPCGGGTILHCMIGGCSPSTVRTLLALGVNPRLRDSAGRTARDIFTAAHGTQAPETTRLLADAERGWRRAIELSLS